MRFISQYRAPIVSVRQQIVDEFANGKSQIRQHGVDCEFRHANVLPHEKELARQRFKFHGMLQEEDEATPVDPVSGYGARLSGFDTDDSELVGRWAQWDRQENLPVGTIKAEVEARLVELQGPSFFLVETVKLLAPWPKYDALRGPNIPERIAKTVADLGLDPQAVIAYERQEKGRDDVIAAVEAVGVPEPGEELVAA